ncbi:hypothetical protein GDZ32_01460 [Lactobacillus helveticus]|uniref:Uncharacterized protein n=1 Tax=Lactobacillus helveticus TaxID=1587 RepID=A0A6A7JZI1_LACHE|nr:hypothetical protein [Lactobacillus helveticus]
MYFFVQTNHTRKELLFLMFLKINLRSPSSLHKIFYSLSYSKHTDLLCYSLLIQPFISVLMPI